MILVADDFSSILAADDLKFKHKNITLKSQKVVFFRKIFRASPNVLSLDNY